MMAAGVTQAAERYCECNQAHTSKVNTQLRLGPRHRRQQHPAVIMLSALSLNSSSGIELWVNALG